LVLDVTSAHLYEGSQAVPAYPSVHGSIMRREKQPKTLESWGDTAAVPSATSLTAGQ
jgi:hypothetical protein